MPGWSRLLLVALLLPGCTLIRVKERPEQFQFTVTAGPGAGPQADALAGDLAAGPENELVPGSARLVASVTTPLGKVDFLQFQMLSRGGLSECKGAYGQMSSVVECAPPGGLVDPLAGSLITVGGAGADGTWSQNTIRVAAEVATIVAVADDGTRYTIRPAAGYGYVVWPSVRGNLTLTALDADGKPLGTAEGRQ